MEEHTSDYKPDGSDKDDTKHQLVSINSKIFKIEDWISNFNGKDDGDEDSILNKMKKK